MGSKTKFIEVPYHMEWSGHLLVEPTGGIQVAGLMP